MNDVSTVASDSRLGTDGPSEAGASGQQEAWDLGFKREAGEGKVETPSTHRDKRTSRYARTVALTSAHFCSRSPLHTPAYSLVKHEHRLGVHVTSAWYLGSGGFSRLGCVVSVKSRCS